MCVYLPDLNAFNLEITKPTANLALTQPKEKQMDSKYSLGEILLDFLTSRCFYALHKIVS